MQSSANPLVICCSMFKMPIKFVKGGAKPFERYEGWRNAWKQPGTLGPLNDKKIVQNSSQLTCYWAFLRPFQSLLALHQGRAIPEARNCHSNQQSYTQQVLQGWTTIWENLHHALPHYVSLVCDVPTSWLLLTGLASSCTVAMHKRGQLLCHWFKTTGHCGQGSWREGTC